MLLFVSRINLILLALFPLDHSCLSPRLYIYIYIFFFLSTLSLSSFWTSRGHRCHPFSSPVLAFNFVAHSVQQSHCSSIVHRMLLTHALALSASQFVHKKKSQRIYTSVHSAGLELTKLTYTRLEDNLIRHRGDRCTTSPQLDLQNEAFHTPASTIPVCFEYIITVSYGRYSTVVMFAF